VTHNEARTCVCACERGLHCLAVDITDVFLFGNSSPDSTIRSYFPHCHIRICNSLCQKLIGPNTLMFDKLPIETRMRTPSHLAIQAGPQCIVARLIMDAEWRWLSHSQFYLIRHGELHLNRLVVLNAINLQFDSFRVRLLLSLLWRDWWRAVLIMWSGMVDVTTWSVAGRVPARLTCPVITG